MTEKKKAVIAIDVDGVLADFVGGSLGILSELAGREVKREEITEWSFCNAIGRPELTEDFYAGMQKAGFCLGLEECDDARELMDRMIQLRDEGAAKLVFVTSPLKDGKMRLSEHWCHERVQWLIDRGWALSPNDVIFCHQKDLIDCHVLIDDGAHNFGRDRYLNALIDRPHNVGLEGQFRRFESMEEVFEAIVPVASVVSNG